jgi:uncharacterized repeat protein (TIGR03843 family)
MDINIDILNALQNGILNVQGEFIWGSNYTFLANVIYEGQSIPAVYKPSRGERPLWDFPAHTLARREAAAYLVSQALGWDLVPPTVYRKKGPLGPGSLQLFVDHDPNYHYFVFSDEDRQRLRPVALFDLLINNADRKGSHILKSRDGHLWLIDHGVCFHAEVKLRTVIWDFVGEPIPPDLCSDVTAFVGKLRSGSENEFDLASLLGNYLNMVEISALAERGEQLVVKGIYPSPDPAHRPFPWPQV